ncbi:MAG: serine hydrolase [Solirubrobacterales bacterium]
MIASVKRRLTLSLAIAASFLSLGVAADGPPAAAAKGKKPQGGGHWQARVADAAAFARGRTGSVSFAVVDERRRLHGLDAKTGYSSASLVKAMLLTAYLNHGGVRGRRLHPADRRLLGPMIRVSDNDAASAVYERIGSGALARLAGRAGMTNFQTNPVWGGCQVTARDQARFFYRLRSLLPMRHRSYALGLLARIVAAQRWGIPHASPPGWRVHFKGGWYLDDDGWRVHQAALLRQGGRRLSVAVLSSGAPDFGYGAATVEGVAARLLRGYR